MSRERPENKVIRKSCTEITQSISDGGLTQWFAARLTEEDFITSARQFCVLGVPDFTQVTQMLGAVESKLKITDTPKETLETFIGILEGSHVLEELARQLKSKYGRYIRMIIFLHVKVFVFLPPESYTVSGGGNS